MRSLKSEVNSMYQPHTENSREICKHLLHRDCINPLPPVDAKSVLIKEEMVFTSSTFRVVTKKIGQLFDFDRTNHEGPDY